MNDLKVIIGPSTEIHAGVHASFIQNPPPGVTYYECEYEYYFLFKKHSMVNYNPFIHPSVSETVNYNIQDTDTYLIHSSRVPVFNSIPWVVDADCLLNTICFGRFFSIGSGKNDKKWKPSYHDDFRLRQRIMLMHYLSDQCNGILFRTCYYKNLFLSYVKDQSLLREEDFDLLQQKTDVIYPTLAASDIKNKHWEKITVVYMGRTYEDKGGDITLAVFSKLRDYFGYTIDLFYIGEISDEKKAMYPFIDFIPIKERNNYLNILKSCHIFFSPTDFESYGMGLIEAACHGMAIVSSCGDGMKHIEELLKKNHNAYLIPTEWSVEERIKAFIESITALINCSQKLREMSENNFHLTRNGHLSLQERNKKISFYYESMKKSSKEKQMASVERQIIQLMKKYDLINLSFSEYFCLKETVKRTRGRCIRINNTIKGTI